jgi:multidrug efflux pump subunit AcrA (membrane-fusion protein)
VRDSAAIDPRSHTLNAEADIENPTGRLFSGSYAIVHLKLPATQGAVTLPANTLLFREEGPRVAVAREGKVVLVPVTIGRDHGNTIELLGALTPKDEVILDPPDSMAEGAAVKVEKVEDAK